MASMVAPILLLAEVSTTKSIPTPIPTAGVPELCLVNPRMFRTVFVLELSFPTSKVLVGSGKGSLPLFNPKMPPTPVFSALSSIVIRFPVAPKNLKSRFLVSMLFAPAKAPSFMYNSRSASVPQNIPTPPVPSGTEGSSVIVALFPTVEVVSWVCILGSLPDTKRV